MADITIHIIPRHLGDGSKVCDVKIGDTILPAVTEHDAEAMADAMKDLIESHTTSTCSITWDD